MSDKTPIEELIEILQSNRPSEELENTDIIVNWYELNGLICDIYDDINQNYVTKEQHKEDVVKAYNKGREDEWDCEGVKFTGEQYYNENHKQ